MNTDTAAGRGATVVLAHGAWADGSSWRRVVRRLHDKGITAYAAALPLTSLAEDVTAVERLLDRIKTPAVLVGHAYAGAVIGSVDAARVSGLVYVAALAPDEGETVADVFYRDEAHPSAPHLEPDDNGYIWLPDTAFADAFAQNASPREHAVLASAQRPIALTSITTGVGRQAWRERPSWYLVAEQDRLIQPGTQQYMAQRMGATVRSLPTDHTPMITAPDLVTDLIVDAVESTRSAR